MTKDVKTLNELDEKVENELEQDDLLEKKDYDEEDEVEEETDMEDEEESDDDDEEEVEESFKEDLDALMSEEATLSEGFRGKAATIFEAALASKVSKKVLQLQEEYETSLNEAVEEFKSDLIEKVDGYLNYVVEQWMKDNELAIETGIRTEISESFIAQLKHVFEEHYVEVPETKVDLVDELATKVTNLEERYNSEVEANIALTESNNELKRDKLIREASEDLTLIEAEKLKSLVEDVEFGDEESFNNKLVTIKESYFNRKSETKSGGTTLVEEAQGDHGSREVSGRMGTYLKALKTTNR